MAAKITKLSIDNGDIVLDASISERHATTVELTRHAIEEGDDPADHARKLPDRLSIEGLFSNTPVNKDEAQARGNTGAGETGYAQEQFAKLLALASSRRAVSIVTVRRSYKNMVLLSLEEPVDWKTADAVRFSATFEEIRFVKTEVVRLELIARPNNVPEKPVTKIKKGKQPTEEKPELDTSIAKKASDWFGFTTPGSGVQ